jgi:hypothetical protein
LADRPAAIAGEAVAFVLKGYPRLSETFIAQEIAALEQLGLNIRIVSLRHPTDKRQHSVNAEIQVLSVWVNPRCKSNTPGCDVEL